MAEFLLSAALVDSAQDPVSGEQVTFKLESSSGPTTFDCSPTDSNGEVACDIELAPDVYSLSLYFGGSDCNSAAGINLKSTLMTWYAVSANRAMFQGEATINGGGLFTFRVQAIDGDQAGQEDHFDIVIWEGTDTEAAPVHRAKNSLAGGNILVHKR